MERRGEAGVEEGGRGDRSGDWNSSTTTRGGPRRVASFLDTATPIDPDPNSAPPTPTLPPLARSPSTQLIAASPWKRNKVSRSGR